MFYSFFGFVFTVTENFVNDPLSRVRFLKRRTRLKEERPGFYVLMIFRPAGRSLTIPFPPGLLEARFLAAVIRPPLLFFAILLLSFGCVFVAENIGLVASAAALIAVIATVATTSPVPATLSRRWRPAFWIFTNNLCVVV